ncbi:hypothetical protein FA95DRAFT_1556484 [Auriscalpium vulgare]|uniref:Uncharacterized protein n=1 Tax=Auriscalpium vulgare TaxID=40419 RepID=A0ACB8S1A9_9AGAM|nr:hypothetical protein FA95DRAFT_1556484 [Auriscalpium vulgare]
MASSSSARSTTITSTSLCLACSSSLPPRLIRRLADPSTSAAAQAEFHLTRCCGRPICAACLQRNPRLARYDPCLACLGGVGAVGDGAKGRDGESGEARNVDGAVRDADVFLVGDEDDEDEDVEPLYVDEGAQVAEVLPPAYEDESTAAWASAAEESSPKPESAEEPSKSKSTDDSGIYYIQPNDTLLGLSLKLGVNARTLCRLNNLPPSTVRTTPHILHTRSFLILPSSKANTASSPPPDTPPSAPKSPTPPRTREADELAHRARVAAQLRLQSLTHETDWRVAQAYVALAEADASQPDSFADDKKAACSADVNMGARAVDRYLDDDEWEAQERRGGRGVEIQRIPLRGESSRNGGGSSRNGWAALKLW